LVSRKASTAAPTSVTEVIFGPVPFGSSVSCSFGHPTIASQERSLSYEIVL
jgi:hypothetical protein